MTGRPQTRSTPARKLVARFRPQLETLKARDVPSTLTVTNNLDSGAGSLRAEIAAAKSKDTIVFAPGLAGQTINLTSGELLIQKNLTIAGPGAGRLAISGGGASRVFEVASKEQVTLSGLTICNDHAGLVGTVYNNDGGGILNLGTLTVSGCVLSGNAADDSPYYGAHGNGGGIYNAGTLTASSTTLSSNQAGDCGGGIYNVGTATLQDTTLSGNTAGSEGGGVFNGVGGILAVKDSNLTDNDALSGADLFTLGAVALDDSTVGVIGP